MERARFAPKGADRQRCRADWGGGVVIARQIWNVGGEFGTAKMEYGWRDWDSKDGIWVESLGQQRWNIGGETDWDSKDGIWVERLGRQRWNMGGEIGTAKMQYGWRD